MFEKSDVDSIVGHMNQDHADAVLLYARAFGGCEKAVAARLQSLDAQGMTIVCLEGGRQATCRVTFERPLTHVRQARGVLVELARRAREQLGG